MARTNARGSHHSGADIVNRITVMGLTVLLVWGEVSRVEGACSRFGHSCFGAHGKRAEIPAGYNANLDPVAMIAPAGGSSLPAEALPDGYDPSLLPLSNSRISPYLVEWILSSRRGESRQGNPSADDVQTVYRRK